MRASGGSILLPDFDGSATTAGSGIKTGECIGMELARRGVSNRPVLLTISLSSASSSFSKISLSTRLSVLNWKAWISLSMSPLSSFSVSSSSSISRRWRATAAVSSSSGSSWMVVMPAVLSVAGTVGVSCVISALPVNGFTLRLNRFTDGGSGKRFLWRWRRLAADLLWATEQ